MAKKKDEPYGGVYENMDFPGYEYQHYPLMMRKGTGKLAATLVVSNKAEEDAAVEDGYTPPERVGAPVSLTEKEHKGLTDEIAELKRQLAEAQVPKALAPAKPVASTPVPSAKPSA